MLTSFFKDKRILILGFGKEGISSYSFIRKNLPEHKLTIADKNPNNENVLTIGQKDQNTSLRLGKDYLKDIDKFDLVIKSPGIYLKNEYNNLYTQSSLFLKYYGDKTIGITGTKGKSTTSSLIHHILKASGKKSLLVGNIGLPPFDIIEQIKDDSIIVYELSSHQLHDIKYSCKTAVFLNIYPEHLDHYPDYDTYINSKINIFKFQQKGTNQIYGIDQNDLIHYIKPYTTNKHSFTFSMDKNADCYLNNDNILIKESTQIFPFIDKREIKNVLGNHNLLNIMAAILACKTYGLNSNEIKKGILSFKSLEHRLEYVGCFVNIHFYNDSIATIPEATIMALKTLPETETLILGGFDRGLDYEELFSFLNKSKVKAIIFTGPAGKRMMEDYQSYQKEQKWKFEKKFENVFKWIPALTSKHKICLLSPAAASYDQFKNFEERGCIYKKLASDLNSLASLT